MHILCIDPNGTPYYQAHYVHVIHTTSLPSALCLSKTLYFYIKRPVTVVYPLRLFAAHWVYTLRLFRAPYVNVIHPTSISSTRCLYVTHYVYIKHDMSMPYTIRLYQAPLYTFYVSVTHPLSIQVSCVYTVYILLYTHNVFIKHIVSMSYTLRLYQEPDVYVI